MRNPLRSEAEAYRFLWLTILGFAAIVLASLLGGPWAGVPVFVAVSLAFTFLYFRRDVQQPPPRTVPVAPASAQGERRILVVANETVGGEVLLDEIRRRAVPENAHVLVVCPALNSRLRHWVSDEDPARGEAQARLDATIARLHEAGINAEGEIGDSDPLQAMEDALRTFGADELIISTHPEGRSNWLERGIVSTAQKRLAVPISHVVVDLERQPEQVR
jgi:nucleotide-binding universal stress UspA family protein